MNISSSKLDVIQPDIFNNTPGVEAWFTLNNINETNKELEIPGLDFGTNTQSPGETVLQNRDRLFKALEIEPDRVAFCGQVHGTRIQFVSSGGTYPETDGLITNIPGLALAIQVADCAAVLLADPARRLVAALHAGWRGAAGDILLIAINRLKECGCEPSELLGYVSPCISCKNFEVGEEVAVQFPEEFVDREHYKKPHVDLKAFLKHQMLNEGMKEQHMEIDNGCTVDEPGRFYSYRRDEQKSGRMLGVIKLTD